MPTEKFWDSTVDVEGDEPRFLLSWGANQDAVLINGIPFDDSALTRLMKSIKRARNETYRSGPAIVVQERLKKAILTNPKLQTLR